MSLFTKLVYTFSCIAIAAGSADDYGLGMIINYDGDIDSSTISDGLKAPNATGRIPISGPNVTEVYPGTMIDGDGDQNGWELSIDVTANVPITDGSKAGRFISAAGLKLLPPAELVQDFGNGTEILKADRDSWVTCFTVFGMDGVSSPITSECTANIQRAVANDQRIVSGSNCAYFWQDSGVKRECPWVGDSYGAAYSFTDRFLATYGVTYWSDTVDKADNLSDYNNFGTRSYPVVITWAHTNTTLGALSEDHVQVVLARAGTTTPGSKVAGGSSLKVGIVGMALSTVGVVFVLLC